MALYPMARGRDDGWWEADVPAVGAGGDYAFVLDGGDPLPDPRSPWQPYGVHGPSRVVRDRDPDAHAERVALRDALSKLGAQAVRGTVLYSTSRPCVACEVAAAAAGVARMVYGPDLTDAGEPRAR